MHTSLAVFYSAVTLHFVVASLLCSLHRFLFILLDIKSECIGSTNAEEFT